VKITVILCTYNRCASLAKTLESIVASKMPEAVEWHVLVVDNNSKDQTREVVEQFCRRYPSRFCYLFERQPGKSFGLTSGIREATGDVLVFVDDDVVVEPTWLQNLTAPLHEARWAGSGGRILPQWSCPPPQWIPLTERSGLAPLVMFDLGGEPKELDEPPFGTNMAFRKTIVEKYGGFRLDLGPCPGSEIRGEDTEFGRRVLQGGERLWYEPAALVYHTVSPNRLQQQYFLRWWFDKGRSDVREFGIEKGTRWVVARVPLYMLRRLANWTLRWAVAMQPSKRFACKMKVWMIAGGIVESYRRPAARGLDGQRA
jgi:glycosyltransferase involved in cell wall biosynthesis